MTKLRALIDRLRGRGSSPPPAADATTPDPVPGICAELTRLAADADRDARLARLLEDSGQRGQFAQTVEHYALEATVLAYTQHFRALVAERHPGFTSATGLDFGCWYGFSTLVLRRLGAPRVHGADVMPEYVAIANRWRDLLGVEGLDFVPVRGGTMGTLALDDASVDWVLANDVFSFAHPEAFPLMARDLHRVLRPGGALYLSDENNPHFPATASRLLKRFREAEIGGGTPERPDGDIFHERRAFISTRFPALDAARVASHAADTAYLWDEEIVRWVEAAERGESPPASRFQPESLRVPVAPVEGYTCGTVTDPVALIRLLEEIGFRCRLRFDLASDAPEDAAALMTSRGRFNLLATRPG